MARATAGLLVVTSLGALGCAHGQPERAGELLALARRQDGGDVAALAQALVAPAARERALAAFALGQLGMAWEPEPDEVRQRAEAALLAALAGEHDAAVRDREIEALGKVGGAASVTRLGALVDGGSDANGGRAPATERARAAIALGLLAKGSNGRLVSPSARAALEHALAAAEPAVRFGGAYGLWRYRDAATRPALRGCLGDHAAVVRAQCAKALGDPARPGADDDVAALAPLLDDGDDRVAAEAARALTKLAMACDAGRCPALEALGAARGPWRAAVMQAVSFERWRDARALPLLERRFAEYAAAPRPGGLDARARGLLQCQAALAHDRAAGALTLVPRCGLGQVDEARRATLAARALAAVGGEALGPLLASRVAAARAAAAEGAPATALPALLGDGDATVVAAAAERAAALAKEAGAGELDAVGPALVAALGRLDGVDAVEALQALLAAAAALHRADAVPAAERLLAAEPYALRQAAAHALAALTGRAVRARAPAPLGPAPRLDAAVVRLRTSRGLIRIRLAGDEAPRTAANFVALVRRRFYDGLTFHRVVPGFVSQGGDPRGDGAGGPGYDIACEINPRRYEEGAVGMALAGRDTGGSQFFIAHAPQPHLDGRYTVFGQVIEGLPAALALVEGDVIVEARVEVAPYLASRDGEAAAP